MRMRNNNIKIASIVLFTLFRLSSPSLVGAEYMSSTNYAVQSDVLGIGGARSTSTNFIAEDTLGELATGEGLTSTNYIGCAGFPCTSAFGEQSITFDLDTSVTDTETAAPYTVGLGAPTTDDTRVSGSTDNVNFIWVDVSSNAGSGLQVSIKNANGANGVVSASVPADNVNSSDGALQDGVERYGVCVVNTTQTSGTLSIAAPYSGNTCAGNGETNDVEQLTTTGEFILSSAGPVVDGRAQIAVGAGISASTAAHADYADTLTFVASATF